MEDSIYDDIAIEQLAKSKFGYPIEIDHVILRHVPVSRVAYATLVLTKKKQLLLYVTGTSKLLLKDIRTIVSRMGLVAELYVPPRGQSHYFDDIGAEKFKAVFPSRHSPTADDLVYYRTLAPYNPALVQIREIKHAEVYQFDPDASSGWRLGAKFAYRRIRAI